MKQVQSVSSDAQSVNDQIFSPYLLNDQKLSPLRPNLLTLVTKSSHLSDQIFSLYGPNPLTFR